MRSPLSIDSGVGYVWGRGVGGDSCVFVHLEEVRIFLVKCDLVGEKTKLPRIPIFDEARKDTKRLVVCGWLEQCAEEVSVFSAGGRLL